MSPDNFALSEAKVQDNTLGPEGPAHKALVITSNSNITLEGIGYIQKYARAGLPVIFSGGGPSVYATQDGSTNSAVKRAIRTLKQSKNVYSVSAGQVARKLQSLRLKPRVGVQTNGTWYTTWREDAQNAMDHAFVFCDTNASSGVVSITSNKTPYFLNPWTGEQTPVLTYQRKDGQVIIPLNLAGNQTAIFGFTDTGKSPKVHITKGSSAVLGVGTPKSDAILHVAASRTTQKITLSSGKQVTLPTGIHSPIQLANWTLVAEHWEAPQNISNAATIAAKHNTTHHLPSLLSWAQIEGLKNASGIGYYSTSFTWPLTGKSDLADGAYLVLPPIKHAARIYLNGHQLPPLDLSAPRADLGQYLRNGRNQVTVVVPTTMWNYIRSIFGQIRNAGVEPLLNSVSPVTPPRSDNGLIGGVKLVPYVNVSIEVY